MRYTHFKGSNLTERANREKETCKRLLDISNNAFLIIGDREGQLVSQHNLANQLRFMDEEEQAKAIINIVVQEASEGNFANVLPMAQALQRRLGGDQEGQVSA